MCFSIASKDAVAILKQADYHMLVIYLIYEFMIYLISSGSRVHDCAIL